MTLNTQTWLRIDVVNALQEDNQIPLTPDARQV